MCTLTNTYLEFSSLNSPKWAWWVKEHTKVRLGYLLPKTQKVYDNIDSCQQCVILLISYSFADIGFRNDYFPMFQVKYYASLLHNPLDTNNLDFLTLALLISFFYCLLTSTFNLIHNLFFFSFLSFCHQPCTFSFSCLCFFLETQHF